MSQQGSQFCSRGAEVSSHSPCDPDSVGGAGKGDTLVILVLIRLTTYRWRNTLPVRTPVQDYLAIIIMDQTLSAIYEGRVSNRVRCGKAGIASMPAGIVFAATRLGGPPKRSALIIKRKSSLNPFEQDYRSLGRGDNVLEMVIVTALSEGFQRIRHIWH